MKLYYTPTSPFVRKVLVAAHELGLAGRITTELLRPVGDRAAPLVVVVGAVVGRVAAPPAAAATVFARDQAGGGHQEPTRATSAFTRSTKAALWWRSNSVQVAKVAGSVTRSTNSLPSR